MIELLAQRPKVTSFGLVPDKQDKFFAKEIEDLLTVFLKMLNQGIQKQ